MKSKEILTESDRHVIDNLSNHGHLFRKIYLALKAAESEIQEFENGIDEIVSDRDFWRLECERLKTKLAEANKHLSKILDLGKDIELY